MTEESLKSLSSRVTVINVLMGHIKRAIILLLSFKRSNNEVCYWQKILKICMGRTHRGQVVSRNRSICLIVGDVVCLCAVTATVLEIKVINYWRRKVFVMVAARGVAHKN